MSVRYSLKQLIIDQKKYEENCIQIYLDFLDYLGELIKKLRETNDDSLKPFVTLFERLATPSQLSPITTEIFISWLNYCHMFNNEVIEDIPFLRMMFKTEEDEWNSVLINDLLYGMKKRPLTQYKDTLSDLKKLFNDNLHLNYVQHYLQFSQFRNHAGNLNYSACSRLEKFKEEFKKMLTQNKVTSLRARNKTEIEFHTNVLRMVGKFDPDFIKTCFTIELENYMADREKEAKTNGGRALGKSHRYHFFFRKVGFSAQQKINAACKMRNLLNKKIFHGDITFSQNDLGALRNSTLGRLIYEYEKLGVVPNTFLKKELEIKKHKNKSLLHWFC